MQLDVNDRGEEITRVALSGRLDISGLHEVDANFHGATAVRGKPTIVDISGVEYIASLGMGMLISCAQSLQRKGQSMVMVGAQGDVESALLTAGIDQAIPMAANADDAVALLGGA